MSTAAIASDAHAAARIAALRRVGLAGIALVVAVLLMAAVFAIVGADPIEAYRAILRGSLGSDYSIGQTLMQMVPLTLTGLAAAIPFTAGLWNIGAEGQLYAGAITGVSVALAFPGLEPTLLTALTLAAGLGAGAAWGMLAGALKAVFDANEVIVTLMLNFVAILLAAYAINNVWSGSGISGSTQALPEGVALEQIWPGTVVNIGIFFVLGAPLVALAVMRWTRLGFGIRTLGRNADAARLAGFGLGRTTLVAFGLGGMFAGLAGVTQVVGVDRVLSTSFSPGWGFTGIAVALTARLNPVWIVPSAFVFSVLVVGGTSLPTSVGISTSTTLVIQALFVLLLLGMWVIPPPFRRRR